MNIASIVGARPQFIKALPVSAALRDAGHGEVLIHTGQHYDYEMSQVFFDELELPQPDHNLEIGSGPHGAQTGRMLEAIERVLLDNRPEVVVVYGDTNSTLAGALAAVKLLIPLIHVEAGLRSFNRVMPEEHNRVLADHCADHLCCPTASAVAQLEREQVQGVIHHVGDTMADMVNAFADRARARTAVVERLGVGNGGYVLATLHRAENTDDPERLRAITDGLAAMERPVALPLHPRTREALRRQGLWQTETPPNVRCFDPVGYLDMLSLLAHADVVMTDSGGVQKEAYLLECPCVTLRDETEWTETVDAGWNTLVGADTARIVAMGRRPHRPGDPPPPVFGTGDAAARIVRVLETVAA